MTDKSRPDYQLLLVVAILVAIGIVMVYSASAMVGDERHESTIYFFKRQLLWFIMAFPVMLLAMRLDYHIFQKISLPLLVISLAFLVAVLLRPPMNNVRRWIRFGPLGFQPSELFRFAFILFLSYSLSKRLEKIKEFKYLLIPYFPLLAVGFLLIIKEPDLGTALTIGLTGILLLFIAGAKLRHLALVILPALAVIFFLVFGLGYEKERIDDYFKSLKDPLAGSYQLKQSVLSLGSGGLWGVGLGEGKQKLLFLPEPHTDFILANMGEEGGFALLAATLTLFLILGWRGFKIAFKAQDYFGFFLAFGITSAIMFGFIMNACVISGILPTTGLPSPFLSYGGTSLFLNLLAIGVLLNISRQRHNYKESKVVGKSSLW
ncbi:MAG: putative lipid II flippase FtsW [candidate division Zixibacteria bacterium]|nr:putative lipid II flippase FtsW [candidate division Zixibacteria bacterium]